MVIAKSLALVIDAYNSSALLHHDFVADIVIGIFNGKIYIFDRQLIIDCRTANKVAWRKTKHTRVICLLLVSKCVCACVRACVRAWLYARRPGYRPHVVTLSAYIMYKACNANRLWWLFHCKVSIHDFANLFVEYDKPSGYRTRDQPTQGHTIITVCVFVWVHACK